MPSFLRPSAAALVLLLVPACGDDAPPTPSPSPGAGGAAPAKPAAPPATAPASEARATPERPSHPDTLDALFQQVLEASKARDAAKVRALVLSMIPTREELRQVLREGVETETFLSTYQGPIAETLVPDGAAASLAPNVTHTDVFVHAATTEDLAAHQKGTTAYAEFPGGMQRFAERVAAPGRTWYAVETREPGKDSGIRYTAFTRLGGRFLLVVKPWRAMKETGGEAPK